MKKILFLLLLMFILFYCIRAASEANTGRVVSMTGSGPDRPLLPGVNRSGVEKRLPAEYNARRGCKIHMAEQAGHFSMPDDPGWLQAEVLSFSGEI